MSGGEWGWVHCLILPKFEYVLIFKDCRTLVIEGKKERSHYDLKQIENIKNT